jgi:hypothetical protein
MEWCIQHWRLLMDNHFRWTDKPAPLFPEIGFFVSMTIIFVREWNRREEAERLGELTQKETRGQLESVKKERERIDMQIAEQRKAQLRAAKSLVMDERMRKIRSAPLAPAKVIFTGKEEV